MTDVSRSIVVSGNCQIDPFSRALDQLLPDSIVYQYATEHAPVPALDELLTRFPEWDVDYEHAKLAPTSTVRGWDTLPVFVR